MPVPKRKRSRARRDKRFANKGIKPQGFNSCSNCEATIGSHQICQDCGFYKGRKVLTTKAERLVKRGEARQPRQKAAMEAQASQQASANSVDVKPEK